MGNTTLGLLLLVGVAASFTELPEKVKEVIDESILAGQQIATAGDLRTMSNMLDAYYFKNGHYPRQDRFEKWLVKTFKESHLKDLSRDHWGNLYVYLAPADGKYYKLTSAGADGVAGTDDDMTMSGP